MPSYLRGVWSWEASANLAQRPIQNTTYCSRDTVTYSPRGGAASLKIVETTNNVDAFTALHFGTIRAADTWVDGTSGTTDFNLTNSGEISGHALSFDWYTGATPTSGDGDVCRAVLGGGSLQVAIVRWRLSDGKLEVFKHTTGHAAGTSQATGSKVYAQNTWYRLWIWLDGSASGTTNNYSFNVWSAEIDSDLFTRDVAASIANTSNSTFVFQMGGELNATTAPGCTFYYDNIVGYSGIAEGEFHDVVVLKATVTGESSAAVAWNPSTGTTHYVLVDELPENGSGTTDSDWVAETVADDELFVMTAATPPTGFNMPVAVVQAYWHRNAGGTKWATAGNSYLWRSQSTTASGGTSFDPGTSYSTGSLIRRRGATANVPLVPEDVISGMEFGMQHGSGDTPDWRVSAVAGEVAWERLAGGGQLIGMSPFT